MILCARNVCFGLRYSGKAYVDVFRLGGDELLSPSEGRELLLEDPGQIIELLGRLDVGLFLLHVRVLQDFRVVAPVVELDVDLRGAVLDPRAEVLDL